MLYAITIDEEQAALVIKLGIQVRVSSLDASKFLLYTTDATPVQISDAFEEIDTYEDFQSISRRLILRFAVPLDPGDYTLVATGLENPAGDIQDDASVVFTIVNPLAAVTEPVPDVVYVQDRSLVSGAEIETLILSADAADEEASAFSVVSTDPADDEYYLETDYNDGLVTIVFTQTPNIEELATYIKVQRKAVSLAPTRWETVDVSLSLHGSEPWVYVQFPEVDDGIYFAVNYKYRIRINGRLGSD